MQRYRNDLGVEWTALKRDSGDICPFKRVSGPGPDAEKRNGVSDAIKVRPLDFKLAVLVHFFYGVTEFCRHHEFFVQFAGQRLFAHRLPVGYHVFGISRQDPLDDGFLDGLAERRNIKTLGSDATELDPGPERVAGN